MSKELFGKYADSVLREYLKVEKSLRDYYNSNLDCSKCPTGESCCVDTHVRRGVDIFLPWDHYVMKRTFPQYMDIERNRDADDPKCSYLSDKGCIIPEGRPTQCTKYVCPPQRRKRDFTTTRVILAFAHISDDMSRIMVEGISYEKELDLLKDADDTFKDIKKMIGETDRISKKYEYESIFNSDISSQNQKIATMV